jgi:2-keto-4-pentenoate hydratase/2-oxohepta-3-ene-1,7-dioic acid hydratase in catechol pathway
MGSVGNDVLDTHHCSSAARKGLPLGCGMRLVRFSADGARRIGVVIDDVVHELRGEWTDILEQCTAGSAPQQPARTAGTWPLDRCTLHAPLADAGRPIFCMGLNYRDHEAEAGRPLGLQPSVKPVVFVKQPEAMADPGEELNLDPRLSTEFDWEVELAVVLGKGGRDIPSDRVHEHVGGYTVLNDITARDLQRGHSQWFIGKNIHRSSPVGPWVVTADEITYPPDLLITLSVNGIEKQRARTSELIFDISAMVSTMSRYVELQPGDLFATGTPAGVGFTRTPPEFLHTNDVMVAEIERIGSLKNRVGERNER